MFCPNKQRVLLSNVLSIYNEQLRTNGLFQRTSVKKYLPNVSKKKVIIAAPKPAPSVQFKEGIRMNELNLQMLSKSLYAQIFSKKPSLDLNEKVLSECKKSFREHNINISNVPTYSDVDFKIPPLEGKDILEHFHTIGEQQVKPYRDILELLLKDIPKAPKVWLLETGWTRYAPGKPPEPVPYPLENGVVFDVEVCVKNGKAPTLATAVSHKAWYGWVSQSLFNGEDIPVTTNQYNSDCLIPFESTAGDASNDRNEHLDRSKLIIGHNVAYDRARIREQYWLDRTGTRFLDTMSLHICISGITSYQRAFLKSKKEDNEAETWHQVSSLNSLEEVSKLYCQKTISKETRNLFVEGSLPDIKNEFQKVMTYCADDVVATYNVLGKLYPLFLERFPHPVTLAGMLELGSAYLPINSNWTRYIANSNESYDDLNSESKILLARRADQACQLYHNEKYIKDIWLWDEDWEVKNLKIKKGKVRETTNIEEVSEDSDEYLENKFKYLEETVGLISKVNSHLPGYPIWYRKLCTKPDSSPDWTPGPHLISTSMRITPKLLSLTWEGYPLHYIREKGWGFLVPFTDDLSVTTKLPLRELLEKCPLVLTKKDNLQEDALSNITKVVEENLIRKEYYAKLKTDKSGGYYKGSGIWCDCEVENACFFIKLPHKNGTNCNVGNPLSKDFLNKFSENVLAGETESAEKVLAIARMLSYWRNNRERIEDQMVVWLDSSELPPSFQDNYGAIIPQVVVCGTLTRRAVEPTWMTASNAMSHRVGSELRSMVQAPPGYNIIGADVDSQELWIASVMGDAYHAKTHGSTPLGWMTLSGTKADGTDMHSITAKAIGISRDHAKVINYARIYGAGQKFAEQLLKQFNPSLSEGEARAKATKMFTLTKGRKLYHLKDKYICDFNKTIYPKWEAYKIAKVSGKAIDEMFTKSEWIGGTESAMFNRLETVANGEHPCTPFLKSRLSRALEPETSDDKYLTTRINWVVQSGAVDFLHLMLVSMNWIMGSKARFCLSFHDEIRYLVPEQYKYQAALAMHVTNLLTRTFCSVSLGIHDLPQSVAFFSSVEVDKVLRKDAKDDSKTPSNPHGLDKGYNIPNGETLDIYQTIEKAGGQNSAWYLQLREVNLFIL